LFCSRAVILKVAVESSIQTKARDEHVDATVCFNCGTSDGLRRNTRKVSTGALVIRPKNENMELDTQPAMKSAAAAMLMTPLPNEEFSFVCNWIDA
jgi:hypothetical protein